MAQTSRSFLVNERERITKCLEGYGIFLSGRITTAQRINFTNMYANNINLLDEVNIKIRTLDTRLSQSQKKWA